MLYTDNLVIIEEILKELGVRYVAWKNYMESKWIRLDLANIEKKNSDITQDPTATSRNTHLEFFVRVLVLTSSFVTIMLTGCKSNVMEVAAA